MKIADFTTDLRTARLVKVTQAFVLCEEVPAATARTLVNQTKAIRAMAEAGEFGAVHALAERLAKAFEALELEDPSVTGWPKLLARHADQVVNATGPRREVK